MVSRCRIYGLGVETNVALGGLRGLSAPPHVDVRMTLGALPPGLPAPPHPRWREYHASDGKDERGVPHMLVFRSVDGVWFRIQYYEGTTIVVSRAGDEVWALSPPEVDAEDTAAYLLGPTLGFVLRLRGTTCLHASAIAVEGRAVVFAGPAGAGKSTLAAAFARRGHAVLTDDVCALREGPGRFHVQPAYPRVRLWPRSVQSLFGDADALPRWIASWDKRFLDLNAPQYRFQPQPLPLAAVYLIGEREDGAPRIEPVARGAALITLVSDTYATYLLDRAQRASEFEVLGRLVSEVPVRRLVPESSLAAIDGLCALVERDLRVAAAEVA